MSFAFDCWSSPNHRPFLAINAFWEEDGKEQFIILDVVEVPFAHTGRNLASVFYGVLKDFGILEKVSVHCERWL